MAETREGLWMSAKERDRLKVLHEVRKGHITQKQAGVEMGLSERWVRTLLKRVGREGDKALRHRLRGRASNHFLRDNWSALADDFRTFLLNPDIFELTLSAV
jgi:hypothetical protein